MKINLMLFFLLLLAGQSYSQSSSPLDPNQAKSTFILQINGKEYKLSEGEELKLDPSSQATVISVKLAEKKQFDTDILTFEYPNFYGYAYETDIGYRNWTLDGNDFVIMFFQFDTYTGLDDIVGEMVAQFGEDNCRLEDRQVKMGKKTLNGKRINVSLIGQLLTIDFLTIQVNDDQSSFLVFQDTAKEDGSPTQESQNTLEIINKTIKFKE